MAKLPNLRTITAADLKNLQIDDAKRHLYWNGQRVRSQIELTWPQTFIAAVGVIAGLATILNGFSSGLNNATTLVCSRGGIFPIIGCPSQTTQAPMASTTPTPPAQGGQEAGPSSPATPPTTAPEARSSKTAAPGNPPSPPPAPGSPSASGH